MSDVENAQTGAIAVPAENTATEQEQTQVQAPESATEEQQKDEQPRDKQGKFTPVQKRINELTRERYEAERRAKDLERRLAELERSGTTTAPDPAEDLDGYLDHLAEQRAQRLIEEERKQAAQQQEHFRIQQVLSQHASREAEYAQANPDYQEAAENLVSVLGVNPVLGEVLMSSEHGPAIVHHLGTHLDELVQLSQLPPHLAALSIARIEAKVSQPKPKPVSATPAPVPSVGGASVAPRGMTDELPIDEWMRKRSQS